jgi:hypothetical protein
MAHSAVPNDRRLAWPDGVERRDAVVDWDQGHRHVRQRDSRAIVASRRARRRAAPDDPSGGRRQGAKLFEGGEQHPLELIDSKKFGTGVVYAIYTPQPNRNGGDS